MAIKDVLSKFNIIPHALHRLSSPEFKAVTKRPIFIVGCGHSGTTLLLRIVGSHPNIHAILDESATFTKKRLYNLRTFDMDCYRAGKKRWVEKTPLHIHHIGKMFQLRPEAKVLIILRDGRDVAASIKKRKDNVEVGINRWVRDNEAGEKWWQDPRVKVLKYENLVADFENQIRDVMDFLGESYTEELKDYHKKLNHAAQTETKPDNASENDHFKYRMWQVSQPLFDGRGRWHQELSDAEKAMFKQKAGEMMVRYGYTTDSNW